MTEPVPNPDPHIPEPAYIGDGVYVSYDGYHIWLAANHHTNKVIALEPAVILELIKYIKRAGFTL